LTNLILDNPSVDLLNQEFGDDFLASAHLRHYMFISQGIKRLESELDRFQQEQKDLFDYMMESDGFRRNLHPIVRTYRRQTRAKGFHPYTQQPLAPPPRHPRLPSTPKSSPPSSTLGSHPSHSSSSSSSSTTASIQMSKEEDDIITAYLKDEGTAQNPICVKDDDNEPLCERCKQLGHTINNCLTRMTHPVCERCKIIGHDTQNCDTPLRTFLFCDICKWKGTHQLDCPHVDMSPVAFQKLRGNIPYDDNSD
jgi:hypothetical protein